MASKRVNILDISVDNISMQELLEKLKFGGVVFTPNVDHLVKLQKDKDFYLAYQQADYCVCDSQLVMYAARFLGKPLKEKVSGSDLFPAFYRKYASDRKVKIFLLGGMEGVAKTARYNINYKVGRDIVIETYSPPFGFENDPTECRKITDRINRSGANVLAVGLGAPKQEKWICQYRSDMTQITTFLAIGATIDFEAGNIQRAPAWMSTAGLEWLYRLTKEPGRLWKRYLVEDLGFFVLVMRQKFNLNPRKRFTQEKNFFE